MTEGVDCGPLAAEYERYRVGYGKTLHSFVGERLNSGTQGLVVDLTGDRLEEIVAAYGLELEKLIPADRPIGERNGVFLFGGRKPQNRLRSGILRRPSHKAGGFERFQNVLERVAPHHIHKGAVGLEVHTRLFHAGVIADGVRSALRRGLIGQAHDLELDLTFHRVST